jgi:hypothetical protein
MDTPLFSLHTMKMNDDEFWAHMHHLEDLCESLPPEFGGFAIKIQMGSGKTMNVPFVRFRKPLPEKAS